MTQKLTKKIIVVSFLILISLVGFAVAIPIPGANRNAPEMIPVYVDGKIVSYVVDISNSIQVSETRIESVKKSNSGKPLWYMDTIKQGIKNDILSEQKITPYPSNWDNSLMKFTYLEYIDYCIKYGVPKSGTFAINNKDGSWIKGL